MIEIEREIERESATRLLQTFARMARVMRHSSKLSHAMHQTFARIVAAGAGHDARPIQRAAHSNNCEGVRLGCECEQERNGDGERMGRLRD